jgi:hypothetical protein
VWQTSRMLRNLRFGLFTVLAAFACSSESTEPATNTSPTSPGGAEPGGGNGSSSSSSGAGSSGGPSSSGGSSKDGGASSQDGGSDGGSTCATCGSELLASDLQNSLYGAAWNIAVDGTNVYVARLTASDIAWLPKTGGAPTRYTPGHFGSILTLVEADSYLYYIRHYQSQGYVMKLPKTGGTAESLFSVAASSIYFDNVIVSDGTLWFSSPSTAGGATRDVRKVDLATGQVSVVHPGGNFLAVNSTHLFWMNSSKLMAAPKDGSSSPAEIAFLGTIPDVIWARNDAVFVGREGEIEITKIGSTSPHTETTLNTPLKLTRSSELATPRYVDGSYAYVIADSAPQPGIYRVPTAGGPAQLFATDKEPLGLTGDATHLYWTNRDGEVRRKAK